MSTADLAIVVNGIAELALIGVIGGLFYTRRLLFAASPKPPAQQPAEPEAKKGGKAAAEQPQADGEQPLSILGGKSTGEAA